MVGVRAVFSRIAAETAEAQGQVVVFFVVRGQRKINVLNFGQVQARGPINSSNSCNGVADWMAPALPAGDEVSKVMLKLVFYCRKMLLS